MRRAGLLMVLLVAAATFAAGCGDDKDSPTPGASSDVALPVSTASGEPGPTASPVGPPPKHFTVDGAGPYLLGAKLADLQAAGQLEEVSTGAETCAQNTTARGTGDWKDIMMSFRPDGKIYIVINRSTSIPTPSGAWLGATLAAVSSIYGPLGQELTSGTAVAYLVTTDTGQGMLFDLDGSKKVMAMIAGNPDYLKSSFLGGTDFC